MRKKEMFARPKLHRSAA
ncbi:hypothetical protein J437_LFUL008540 [Ladona fulva]|uniref:Uncharacterized protein n=1 Tax=Ladona fulva TaxID=123851 RepID=A0A8K0K7T6_LADFU|nr:hypothetical protein J437_LFUL008540 [Ladona fulva]